jgi:hypothetical protein
MGNICCVQGDLVRAEQHFRLALDLYETSFPDRHTDAMLSLLYLVQVLEWQGRAEEARQAEELIPAMNAKRRAS